MQVNGSMNEVMMSAMGEHGIDKTEDVRQLKWPLVTHFV